MLQSLDTLIGFAVIMSMLSLLILTVTQMISASFSMRGKNLANALAITFRTIDPRIGEHAEAVVEHILTQPILSDSVLTATAAKQGQMGTPEQIAAANAQAELSRADAAKANADAEFQTAEAGANSAALDLKQACAGIAQASPNTLAHASAVQATALAAHLQAQSKLQLARARVRETMVALALARLGVAGSPPSNAPATSSSNAWRTWLPSGHTLANAVRSDEVYRILHRLAALSSTEAIQQGLPGVVPAKISALLAKVATPGAMAAEARRKVSAALSLADFALTEKQKTDALSAAGDLGEAVQTAAAQGFDHFQRWFDSAQDRAQQWFLMNMRMVTGALAIVAAFALQLDASEIYRFIATNSTVRNQLVQQAPAAIERQQMLNSVRAETSALDQWEGQHPTFSVIRPGENAPRSEFVKAVQLAVSAAPESERAGLLKGYTDLIDKLANAQVGKSAEGFQGAAAQLSGTGFQLIPDRWHRWPAPDTYGNHFVGMLFMASLLTLGAPFWFNLLKSLSNLRPTLAQLVEDKPRQTPPVGDKKQSGLPS